MNRFGTVGAFAVVLALTMLLCGCPSSQTPATGGPGVTAVNALCPMTGKPIDPAVATRTFEGKTVGFCCQGCPPAWDKLSTADKKAKLAAVMKSSPAPTAAPAKAVNAKCPITGKPVDPAVVTRTFEGKTVGFCCPACPPAWDKLSDADKKAKLAAAMK